MPRKGVVPKKRKVDESSISRRVISPYLVEPATYEKFRGFVNREILHERFVLLKDVEEFGIPIILQTQNLLNLFSKEFSVMCYPRMVYLFYTNLKFDESIKACSTQILDTTINITVRSFGEALAISHTGKTLDKIEMDKLKILEKMFLPGYSYSSKMKTIYLTPPARILAILCAYNLTPRSGSYALLTDRQAKCVYALIGGIKVNWAYVILENLIKSAKKNDIPLAHGHYLTMLFNAYGIDLTNESDVLEPSMIFDAHAIGRMGLALPSRAVEVGGSSSGGGPDKGKRVMTAEEMEDEMFKNIYSQGVEEEEVVVEEDEDDESEEEDTEEDITIRQLQTMLLKKIGEIKISQGLMRKEQKAIKLEVEELKKLVVEHNQMTEATLKEILMEIKLLKAKGNGSS